MKLYSFLCRLCCLFLLSAQSLSAQTTIGFEGLPFDPATGFSYGYGKAFGIVEPGDIDELPYAGGFVFAITASHSLTSVVSVAAEGYNNSTCISTNNYGSGVVSQWIIKKNDNTKFQFKGIFLKDAGFGSSTEGTITAYRGGQKVGAAVNVSFDGSLNQSFIVNPDFYDVDEVRIEALDLDIYLDQFMAGPPYGANVNAPAQVSSIVIDGNPNSSATTVNFLVMFDKPVMNVSVADFIITSTGIPPIAAIASVTGLSASLYKVSVTGVTGEGTIKLGVHAYTDIATVVGNVTGTPAFTAGEIHSVGACGIENFDQGESDNASSFSNNGFTYQLKGNWKVRKYSPVRGLNGSDFHLSGTGTAPMVIKALQKAFKVNSFYLFLSNDINGLEPTTSGTITITGKSGNVVKFTKVVSSDFNTSLATDNGYTLINLGSNGAVVIDELEIVLGGAFQYVDMDNINLCAVMNNPPVIGNLNGDAVNFTEGSSAVLIDFGSNATVTDSDSPDFAGGNVTVSIVANRIDSEDVLSIRNEGTAVGQIGVSGSNVTYGGIPIGTLNPAGGTGTTNLGISLNTASTPAIVQALIRNLTYMNTNATNPSTAARTVAVTINDGDGGTSTAANVTVNVVAVNDAPTLTATALNPTYTEGGPAVPMFSNAQSSTIEAGQYISALTLTVSGVLDGTNELIVVDDTQLPLVNGNSAVTTSNGIDVTVSLVGTTATVTLSKTVGLSTSDLNTIVNGIAYRNTSENPTTAARAVTIIAIRDNGGIANGGVDLSALAITSTINVMAVNDAAVVTTSGGNTTFTEGTSGVAIDGAVALSDPDNATLASATVAITGNLRNAEDMLVFTNDEASMGNIASSYNVTAGVMTLTSTGATATLAQWQTALRAVSYENTSQNPNTAARTISFKVNDGSLESTAATKQLAVIAVNDAPTIVAPASLSLVEDVPTAITGISFTDADAGSAPVIVTLVASEGNLFPESSSPGVVVQKVSDVITLRGAIYYINLFITSDLLMYTPVPNSTADVTLTVSINDVGNTGEGGPKSATTSILMEITPVNDPPVVTLPASITVTEDVESPLTGISFSDVDAGTGAVTIRLSVPSGALSATSSNDVTVGGSSSALSLTGTIAEINIFIAGGAVKFTTANNATNNVLLTVSINDNGHTGIGGELTDTKTTTLLVTAVNDAPVNSVPETQSVDQDATLVFSAANNNLISISDVDAGAGMVQVTLTATNGRITLSGMTGVSLIVGTGANDVMMTFSGTITAINTALNGLVFTPTAGYNGSASMMIETNDMGNTGSGDPKTATDIISIAVKPLNPSIASVGTLTPNGMYKVGDNILITVTFDQPVMVDNAVETPSLLLETGLVDRSARYVGGSGTKTLIFTYEVQSGDQSAHLDYQSTSALALNGSSIKSAEGKDAILTLATLGELGSLASNSTIVIDGVLPRVTSVGVPPDGYYLIDQDLDFTVNFSKAVTVNTTGGSPHLTINVAGQIVYADYVSGSGTNALRFRYTVISGLQDHDGIVLTALAFNGGIIRDVVGNNALLTLNSVDNTSGVKIDSKPPAEPIDFVVVGQDKKIALAWTANAEPDFEKYLLYVRPEGAAKMLLATILKGRNSYMHAGLPNGVAYEFFLVAVDQVGNESEEASTSAKTMGLQTIDFALLANLTYGQQAVELIASATSNLPVFFTSSDPSIAQVYQDNNDAGKWKINAKKVGTVTITVVQPGNNEYLPAAPVAQTLTIVPASLGVRADMQTKVYGEADPRLTYTVNVADLHNGDAASVVSGRLGRMAGENVGSYVINNVDLAANNYNIYYEAAELTIFKAKQTIRFTAPEVLGRDAGTVALDVQTNSGLPLVLSVDDPMVATVTGSDLTVLRLGTIRITATQAGNENYEAAVPVTVSVRIVADASAKLPILVHQALSPNGDGINEFLTIEGIADYPDNKVTIFDKNGVVQAEIEGYNNRDRVFTGRDSRDGTYYYYLDLKVNGSWKREKGYFVIRR